MRRAAVRAYGLTPPGGTTLDAVDGVRFYDFRLIGKPTKLRRFKDEYRRRLDDLRVADASLVVDEAVAAFRRNTQLLKELDFVVLGATEAAAPRAADEAQSPGPVPLPRQGGHRGAALQGVPRHGRERERVPCFFGAAAF